MKKHILEYSHLICSLFLCLLACVCNGCTEEPLQGDGRAVIRLGAKSPTRAVNSLADLSAAGANVESTAFSFPALRPAFLRTGASGAVF